MGKFLILVIIVAAIAGLYFTGNLPGFKPAEKPAEPGTPTAEGTPTKPTAPVTPPPPTTAVKPTSDLNGVKVYALKPNAYPLKTDPGGAIVDPKELNEALAALGLPAVESGAPLKDGQYTFDDYPLGKLRVQRSDDGKSIARIVVESAPTVTSGTATLPGSRLDTQLTDAKQIAVTAKQTVDETDSAYRAARDKRFEEYLTLTDRIKLYEANKSPDLADKLDEAKIALADLGPVDKTALSGYTAKRAALRAELDVANKALDAADKTVERLTKLMAERDKEAGVVVANKEKYIPDVTVYVGRHGSLYHRATCGSLHDEDRVALPLKTALENYKPCQICNPATALGSGRNEEGTGRVF
ncbi:MAG: hypothetical protein GC159_18490 [Phycisphaera sp.]|nr:hypothetical protein [Phycisphaera sp.]